MKETEKILVTGANGFIGSGLCAALASRGLPYMGAVRSTATKNQIAVGDLDRNTRWGEALAGCKVVIHLAGRAHVLRESGHEVGMLYRTVNLDATLNLARQAVQCGARRFVFVSSIKVNGDGRQDGLIAASDAPIPNDLYGQIKWETEQALQAFAAQSGLELVIVRPPLVYGPGVKANFHGLIRLVDTGLPLPFARVKSQRSMIARDNLVDFLILCASHPDAVGRTFLISDGEDVSLSDLIRLIAQGMGHKPRLFSIPVQWMSAAAHCVGLENTAQKLFGTLKLSDSQASDTLGWRPVVSIREAIAATVSDYKSRK